MMKIVVATMKEERLTNNVGLKADGSGVVDFGSKDDVEESK